MRGSVTVFMYRPSVVFTLRSQKCEKGFFEPAKLASLFTSFRLDSFWATGSMQIMILSLLFNASIHQCIYIIMYYIIDNVVSVIRSSVW